MWIKTEKISDKRLALLISTAILISVLVFMLPTILISVSQVINLGETRDTEQEVLRSEKIIRNDIDRLDRYLLDWAAWDETYQFAQDQNQDYITGNLSDSSLINLEIDIFIVLNTDNQPVFTKFIDSTGQGGAALTFDVNDLLGAYPDLTSHSDLLTGQKGIAVVQDQPYLIASHAIITNMKTGPASGTLIWGRVLNEQLLEAFSQLAERRLAVFPRDQMPTGMTNLPDEQTTGKIFTYPQDAQIIMGFKMLSDLNKQYRLVLQVENQRELYLQGRSTVTIFSIVLLVLALTLFSGSYHFISAFLKSRRTSRLYLQRFKTIVNNSSEAILLVASDCHILEANPASQELLNWTMNQSEPSCLKSLLTFEPEINLDSIQWINQTGGGSEYHCVRHDGNEMYIELSASLVVDGEVNAFSLILRDITARKMAEHAIKASEERYMLAANGSNDGLWDWDLLTNEVYYSPRWKAMLGYQDSEIRCSPEEWFSRVHPDDALGVQTQLSNHTRSRTSNFQCEYRILHRDGEYRWMLARGVAVWDPSGYAHRIAGSQTDITERKKLEDQLRYDALHDSLTGLGNRTLLLEHLCHINERKKRNPDLIFALFFLDFDRFKQVNDTLGHQAGDKVLIEVSRRLHDGLRTADSVLRLTETETVARIAGDEFVLLLEDFQVAEDVQKVADRIAKLINKPYIVNGQKISLSASIGLVVPHTAYDNPEDIIRDADIAMYRAKQLGGQRMIQFSQEMYQGTIARMQMESDLRKAIENNEFEVFYQPVFSLDNDRIVGFEALVRWNHPHRGLLLPGDFIKTADEIGAIIPIGLFVLGEACHRMQSWQKSGMISSEFTISVNLSARQINAADLPEKLRAILESSGFEARKLWLEITEGTLLENNEGVLARLNELRNMGVRIEIDDFGTGYSSLSYLQNLPIDGFKIDRSFIKEIPGSGNKIIKSLIELGHSMGLVEIAEGVETEDQREYLKQISCQFAQGFLMSRPISAEAIEELLSQPSGIKYRVNY